MRKTIAYILLAALLLTGCAGESTAQQPESTEPVRTENTEKTDSAVSDADKGIIISEFMEKNRAVLRDGDGEFSDWIELYNSGSESVSLGGWSISDKKDGRGWSFPAVTLDPGERLIVFASGKDRDGNELHTDFSISGDECLYLMNENAALVCEAQCLDCAGDVATALGADGEWHKSLYPTPGFENSYAGYEAFQQTLAPLDALVINEVVVANFTYRCPTTGTYSDWVEIKNISDAPVSLADYCLTDDEDTPELFRLPDMSLDAGESLIVLCDTDGGEYVYDRRFAYADFALDDSKEQLFLYNKGELADYASLRDIPYSCSYGRMDGENGFFWFASPTPGAENSDGKRRVSESPETLTKDGVYEDVSCVTVELTGSGTLRYTLDGSAPTEESAEYTEPIELDRTAVVRVRSFEEGALPSRPLNLSYIINEGHVLPVMSFVSDSPEDFEKMYNGPHKGLELPGALSLYEEDSSFTIPCGISLNGETSLSMTKKNMSVRFRGAYGKDKLKYDIFKDGGVTEFRNLLLRCGQDYGHAIVRNELAQSLCTMAGCNVVNQRSIYTVLYINGEYSGIYTLKEKANEQLYADLAGVSRESVELIEADAPFDSSLYQDVILFAAENDMSKSENYERICEQVDIDSLIDWVFIEGFCSNSDVTHGNLRYVRSSENDGKWRYMFYDLDAAFAITGSIYFNLMSEFADNNIQAAKLVVALMDNGDFCDRFLNRAHVLLRDVLTNEAVLAELDRLCDIVAPEVERDYARYGMELENWEYNLDYMRGLIEEQNWRQMNIENLCFVFDLDDAEREHYFGDIDGK